VISVQRVIPASPEAIFNLLADPRQHHLLDGSGTVNQVVRAPERLSLGAKFSMGMKDKVAYTTTNTVVAFEENRTIAWCHFAKFVWRYDLEAVEGGTRVTESFDYNRPWGFVIEAFGWPARNRAAMTQTLATLESILSS
jgi:uncharacterized protein YndB with AHSA1/START domain